MKDLIINQLVRSDEFRQQTKQSIASAIENFPFDKFLTNPAGMIEEINNQIVTQIVELSKESFLLGKTDAFEIIAKTPKETKPEPVPKELTANEMRRLLIPIRLWEAQFDIIIQNFTDQMKLWIAEQKSQGRSDEAITTTIKADISDVNEEGLPSGRFTGSHIRALTTSISDLMATAERAGYRSGMMGI